MKNIEHSTIALAGLFQSAYLVKQIAKQGMVDQSYFETAIASILKLDAPSTADVYGGVTNVQQGFRLLIKQFGAEEEQTFDHELMRYVLNMVVLERKLQKDKTMLSVIGNRVREAISYAEHNHLSHEHVLDSLANLYLDTMSNLTPRIQVTGERRFLENEINAKKIRVMLLAGVRSAALWRQKGGSKWQFVFSRKKIINIAKCHLESLYVTENPVR
ncbi:high frequency lysogenization protein HflD [Candidatus Albibeggiatoa sp. nov. NOAA]|uniref:high frequency lysogenization protein HflD n=1 Tax=Candidatus Albibeggiatoa sp. nov. NOAA TaxID=3162724 RepID=UPI0033052D56|nr:high frequency lysogenization protein HflD [Thiotrichaceae bacterium]